MRITGSIMKGLQAIATPHLQKTVDLLNDLDEQVRKPARASRLREN
jgi:hypothetical protein